MTITFQNPGEIDIRGATIAGLSAKVGDSPIGKFGTGLKYAIASILRWGGEVTIYSGTDCYIFESEAIDFRGSEHHQVVMSRNDGPANPIGITATTATTGQLGRSSASFTAMRGMSRVM